MASAAALAPTPRAHAEAFLEQYGALFGLPDPSAELRHRGTVVEQSGAAHLSYEQRHRGVEVFGARLLVHLDAAGDVIAANGTALPAIDVDVVPRRSGMEAEAAAVRAARELIAGTDQEDAPLAATSGRLLIFGEGLTRGLAGPAHLVYEVEVRGGPAQRDFFYVDAHSGKIVERIRGIHEALQRRVYQTQFDAAHLIWTEGNAEPSGDSGVDGILSASREIRQLFGNLSNGTYLSYDGGDHVLEAVTDIVDLGCPNAFWDGVTTNFCDGVTSDDVVAHEWTHAYTEYTGGLVYAWQPGALNEAYSDIFGETVDLLNGTGTDLPDVARGERACSSNSTNSIGYELVVHTPATIAGSYPARAAEFGADLSASDVSGNVVLADDATGTPSDGCEPFVNAGSVAGKIAMVIRGRSEERRVGKECRL